LVLALGACSEKKGDWTVEEIALGGRIPIIALDAAQQPHVIFVVGDDDDHMVIKYAVRSASGWKVSGVAQMDGSWGHGLLAMRMTPEGPCVLAKVDENNMPYLGCAKDGWYPVLRPDLRFPRGGAANAVVTDSGVTITPSGKRGSPTPQDVPDFGAFYAIALGPGGTPYIAYPGPRGIWLARWAPDFQTALAQEADDAGNLSLFIDTAGIAQVSYTTDRQMASRTFHYSRADAPWAPWHWTTSVVEKDGNRGQYVQMAFGPDGKARMMYSDLDEGSLRYAKEGASGWETQTIPDSPRLISERSFSIAADPAGKIQVAYAEKGAQYARLDGEKWLLEKIDDSNAVDMSLAVDNVGVPHAAYVDYTTKKLLYAVRKPD
jgi:hypothetical protein